MAILSYDQALDFWFGRVNYEQRGMPGNLQELKLDRMERLLALLGRPQDHLRIVHVAGSKGKGSTAAMLASILQAAGFRTGLFTSPHLSFPEERVQVDRHPIGPGELVRAMDRIEPACRTVTEEQSSEPTFFEIATALGLLHFVEQRAEWAVLEVGLGGRFDSTNVCTPELSVITSISFDHQEQLGYTLASIAAEKAGIIKLGRTAVSGVVADEPRSVIERIAAERGAPLRELGRDFHYQYRPGRADDEATLAPRVRVSTWQFEWPWMELALWGEHQAANAAAAIAGVEVLREAGHSIPGDAVRAGLAEVCWPARMELLGRRPFIVLDCAHNLASIQALIDTLQSSYPPVPRTLVFGASRDKDLAQMIDLLSPHFDAAVFTQYLSSPRSAAPEDLVQHWRAKTAFAAATPSDAWKMAIQSTHSDGLICITGSVFLAGEMRSLVAVEFSGRR